MLRRDHQLRADLGRIYSFSLGLRMEEDGTYRRPDVMACRIYARQTLEDIARSQDDPFNYRLLDLWLDVFQRPWDQPTTLHQLLDDLARQVGSGDLKVYLEYDPNDRVFDVSGAATQKTSTDSEAGSGEVDEARTQDVSLKTHKEDPLALTEEGGNIPSEKNNGTSDASTTDSSSSEADEVDTLFRRDTRGPEVIFEEGFKPRKPDADVSLKNYVKFNEPSQYVGTSKVPSGAAEVNTQAGAPGYLYEIENPGNGIDVNEAYPGNPFSEEQEIAVPGGIEAKNIKGCTPIDGKNNPTGDFVDNPNYSKGD